MRCAFRRSSPWICLAALAACAAPRPVTPPAAGPAATAPAAPASGQPAAPAPALPPPAGELETYALVRDDPTVVSATAALDAAPPSARAAALMARARVAFAAARALRVRYGGAFASGGWPGNRERFVAYCELALRDLDELLAVSPRSPEAAEATFTIGQIYDYPHLELFDEALEGYRLTIERHPGTPWAAEAVARIAVIERIKGGLHGGPHGAPPR